MILSACLNDADRLDRAFSKAHPSELNERPDVDPAHRERAVARRLGTEEEERGELLARGERSSGEGEAADGDKR